MAGIQVGPTGLIELARWTLDRLAQFAVYQPPENRLILAARLLEDVNARRIQLKPDDDALLNRVAEAQWTILEQHIITRALGKPGRRLHPKQVSSLEWMLSGAQTEENDRNPLARNTQFELYTGATLTMGDVATRLGEPDLRADYFGQEIGIAAKRVRSSKKVAARLNDAVAQIKASGMSGIVAINVDVLIKTVKQDVNNNEDLTARVSALSCVDELLAPHPEIIGCLIFARDVVWDFSGAKPRIMFASTHSFRTYPRDEVQERQGEEFWERTRRTIDRRLAAL